jgi:hypothetical protein
VATAVMIQVDPALMTSYKVGWTPLVAYIDCAGGGAKYTVPLPLTLSSDKRYLTYSDDVNVSWNFPGDTCSFSTDLSAQLRLSHAQLSTGTTGTSGQQAATAFFN